MTNLGLQILPSKISTAKPLHLRGFSSATASFPTLGGAGQSDGQHFVKATTNLGRLGCFGPAVENWTAFPLYLRGVLIRDESLVRLRHGGGLMLQFSFHQICMSLLGPSDREGPSDP